MARILRRYWDTREYVTITRAFERNGKLFVSFADASHAVLDAAQVLPPDTGVPHWKDLAFTDREVLVPTSRKDVEIPWITIRSLSDERFRSHLTRAAEEEARQVGQRLRRLRKQRHLSAKEVAKRAGITPQSLSRIENGHHDVVFATLRRILSAMGSSLKELAALESQSRAENSTVSPCPSSQIASRPARRALSSNTAPRERMRRVL